MDRCGVLACTPARRLHSCSQWRAAAVPAMHAQFGRRRRPSSRTLRSCGGSAARSRGRLSCATRCCASRCAAPPLLRQQTPFNASDGTANARGYPHAPRLLVRPSPRAFPGACATAQIARVVCGVSRFACASHAAEGLAVGWPHSACACVAPRCLRHMLYTRAGVRGIRPQHKRAHERGEGVYQGGAKTLAWLLAPLQAWATAWQSFRTRFKWLTAIVQPCEARERDDLRRAREDRPPVRGSNALATSCRDSL
jgi:hypothetical protein